MQAFLVVALLALGFALRLTGLDIQSFWYDEGCFVHIARADDLIETLRRSRYPPLALYALRGWLGLFGESDAALRALPALVSCGSLVLFARLARLLLGERWVGAVALYAVSPFHVWYGQELSPYPFVEFGALVALLGTAGAVRWPWLTAALGTALATGVHYLGPLIATVVVLVPVAAAAQKRLSWTVALKRASAGFAGVLVWTPWFLLVFPDQLATKWGHQARTSAQELAELASRLILVDASVIPEAWRFAGIALGLLLTGAMAVAVYAAIRTRDASRQAVVLAFLSPIVFALILIQIVPPNFQPKYLMPAAPGAALAVGAGLAYVRPAALGRGLMAAAVVGCLTLTLLHKQGNRREDYRTACAEVVAAWKPGDLVVVLSETIEDYNQAPARHYLRRTPEVDASVISSGSLLVLPEPLPAGIRIHAIGRDSTYTQGYLKKMEAHWKRVAKSPMRFRVQYVRFEV